ncbi:hypothetical protein [Cetobacterium sp.]|uniref:hypothetical protein n=1 Tax=Cetobacterium sp. TaxID=2071632 RepID=UPI002FC75506
MRLNEAKKRVKKKIKNLFLSLFSFLFSLNLLSTSIKKLYILINRNGDYIL